MSRVIDAKGAKLIGSPAQIVGLFGLLGNDAATIVDLKGAEILISEHPIDQDAVTRAIEHVIAGAAKAQASVLRKGAKRTGASATRRTK